MLSEGRRLSHRRSRGECYGAVSGHVDAMYEIKRNKWAGFAMKRNGERLPGRCLFPVYPAPFP